MQPVDGRAKTHRIEGGAQKDTAGVDGVPVTAGADAHHTEMDIVPGAEGVLFGDEQFGERTPDAVVCDDAAPSRHHSRLRAAKPRPDLPVVTLQGRGPAAGHESVWAPPYRLEDLVDAVRR